MRRWQISSCRSFTSAAAVLASSMRGSMGGGRGKNRRERLVCLAADLETRESNRAKISLRMRWE